MDTLSAVNATHPGMVHDVIDCVPGNDAAQGKYARRWTIPAHHPHGGHTVEVVSHSTASATAVTIKRTVYP